MRKWKALTIEAEGRDRGKVFLLTEMPAMQAEEWALSALLALGRAGVEVPDEVVQQGAAAVLGAGLAAFRNLRIEDAKPLLDRMMDCVRFIPDPARTDPVSEKPFSRLLLQDSETAEGDIQEVTTLLQLRSEVIELHLGFSIGAVLSALVTTAPLNSSRTRTRRRSSGRS